MIYKERLKHIWRSYVCLLNQTLTAKGNGELYGGVGLILPPIYTSYKYISSLQQVSNPETGWGIRMSREGDLGEPLSFRRGKHQVEDFQRLKPSFREKMLSMHTWNFIRVTSANRLKDRSVLLKGNLSRITRGGGARSIKGNHSTV